MCSEHAHASASHCSYNISSPSSVKHKLSWIVMFYWWGFRTFCTWAILLCQHFLQSISHICLNTKGFPDVCWSNICWFKVKAVVFSRANVYNSFILVVEQWEKARLSTYWEWLEMNQISEPNITETSCGGWLENWRTIKGYFSEKQTSVPIFSVFLKTTTLWPSMWTLWTPCCSECCPIELLFLERVCLLCKT